MKRAKILCLLLLMCLLAGCGQTAAPAPEGPKDPPAGEMETPPADAPQMSALSEENAPARKAYAAALKTLLDTNVLPDGTDYSDSYIGSIQERETMAENQFSVYDVDGDGREELILCYTTTYTAGERLYVLDWDEETGETRVQLTEFPNLLAVYDNGVIQAGWSHNQGRGGRCWPYTLYTYDADADGYTEVGAVDAWDSNIPVEGYPADIDVSGAGIVYYIYKDRYLYEDMTTGYVEVDPVDEAVYLDWLDSYVGDANPIDIPYDALTAENIRGLLAAG